MQVKFVDDLALKSNFPDMFMPRSCALRPRQNQEHEYQQGREASGVKGILTYKDPEIAALRATNAGWTDGVDTVSHDRMMWRHFRDRRVLGDHACWVTDELAPSLRQKLKRLRKSLETYRGSVGSSALCA